LSNIFYLQTVLDLYNGALLVFERDTVARREMKGKGVRCGRKGKEIQE
jgi:hypothetical protein